MAFVVDASIGLAWLLKDETSVQADTVLAQVQGAGADVPSHWPLEIASGLWSAERRGRVTATDTAEAVEMLQSLPIIVHEFPQRLVFGALLGLAREQGLTVYDAAYLELAMRRRIPLATLDADLVTAAKRVGVQLVL